MRTNRNYANVQKCPLCGQYYEVFDNEEQCVDCTIEIEYHEKTKDKNCSEEQNENN